MSITIYHNPRCSKSRQTLQLLQDKGIEPTIIEYLKTPPNAETLDTILTMLNMEPRELMRKQEAEYKEQGLNDDSLSPDQLIKAMTEYPKIIERPIVVSNDRAAIGRPPENVEKIL
ncbi:MAG: arsenate reductase (glutaredoxin) [Methylococcales bacterium]